MNSIDRIQNEADTTKIIQRNLQSHAVQVAAACASVGTVYVGYPFDSIKTRMQALKYLSLADAVKKTYASEGILGFYRGCTPVLIWTTTFRVSSFSIYQDYRNSVNQYLSERIPLPTNATVWDIAPRVWVSSFVGGAITGTIVGAIAAPLEFIKVLRQLERIRMPSPESSALPQVTSSLSSVSPSNSHPPVQPSSIPTTSNKIPKTMFGWGRHISREKGPLALYTGFHLHVLREFVGTGCYFSMYELFKYLMIQTQQSQQEYEAGPTLPFQNDKNGIRPWIPMLCGGIAGVTSWIILFPIDLVKTVIQKDVMSESPRFKTSLEFIRSRFKKRGFTGFYQGLGPQLIRSFPVHALNFFIYEHVLEYCQSLKKHDVE